MFPVLVKCHQYLQSLCFKLRYFFITFLNLYAKFVTKLFCNILIPFLVFDHWQFSSPIYPCLLPHTQLRNSVRKTSLTFPWHQQDFDLCKPNPHRKSYSRLHTLTEIKTEVPSFAQVIVPDYYQQIDPLYALNLFITS